MADKQPDLKDIEPGSDADATPDSSVETPVRGPKNGSKPAPLETGDGEQNDDNVDDKGNKHGGDKHEQPS